MFIATARDAARLLEPLFEGDTREQVAVVHLDADGRMLAVDRQPGSAVGTADLPLRQIIGAALAHGSQGLILAHNHPSGDASPSRADLDATRRLADTAASLGIRVHDHLIFAGRNCRSLRAMGLL